MFYLMSELQIATYSSLGGHMHVLHTNKKKKKRNPKNPLIRFKMSFFFLNNTAKKKKKDFNVWNVWVYIH